MRASLVPSIVKYKKQYLKHDIIAALVVTAIAVPESLGYAVIVGLPPITGLYTAMIAPIIFALLASTRRLIIGADSATAALIASGALLVSQAGSAGYTNAVAVIGLLTAGILFLIAVLRLGFLANLISRPVLIGFLAGVGIQLIITKLPAMLGVETHGSIGQQFIEMVQRAGVLNGMTVTVSILVVGVIIITRRTKIPGELLGLIFATVFAAIFHAGDYGVKLIGSLPNGLPSLSHPGMTLSTVVILLPAALSIAVVILAQSSAVIRSIAGEHDEKVRLNQDMFALSIANAASALTHGFAVNGSPPRSVAADVAGGRSQLVNVLMGVFISLLVLFGSHLFTFMPLAALSSIVFMLGWRLIRFHEFRYLWHAHRTEFFVALTALATTALFGVLQGVLIAVIVSLMERLMRQYHPRDDVLLRDSELSDWAMERLSVDHRHSRSPEGLLVYSFDGSLFFENIAYFTHRLKKAIEGAKKPVHYAVVDAGAIDSIDYTAVEGLKTLDRQLGADDIQLGFAHVSPNLLKQFQQYGIIDLVGKENIFSTLNAAIKSQPSGRRSALEMVQLLALNHNDYVVIGGTVLEALHMRETKDVDLVVSDEVYTQYRDVHHWKEYVQDNGKKTLSHEGYTMMHTWMGNSLKHLARDSFDIDGVPLINLERLIEGKRHLGRRKDMADITLLTDYLASHPTYGRNP